MIPAKLKKMEYSELEEELKKRRTELAETVFNVRVGKEKDYAQIKLERKNIARILVLLRERKKNKGSKEEKTIGNDKPAKKTMRKKMKKRNSRKKRSNKKAEKKGRKTKNKLDKKKKK